MKQGGKLYLKRGEPLFELEQKHKLNTELFFQKEKAEESGVPA